MKKFMMKLMLMFGVAPITAVLFGLMGATSVKAAECTEANLRWASSSNSIYVSGPVDCTLSKIKEFEPHSALELVDAEDKVWWLGANLRLENGARLLLHGENAGGDVNWLRLKSENSGTNTDIVFVRADWGVIDIADTKVTSWDGAGNDVDTEYGTYKRAFIHVRSREADGAKESRMDIRNSEVAYLGYYGAEAYGLAWKVMGGDIDPSIYDRLNVYGDVANSNIHHNYFGAYTFGAEGMNWSNNQIHHNVEYGLDPHDDSDFLVIEGNHFYNNGNHGMICSKRCNDLIIRNNVSNANDGNGFMLHRHANDSLVENNQAFDNTDSGFALFESHNNVIRNNVALRNRYAMRLSVGSADNLIEGNELGESNQGGIFFYQGSDIPLEGDGRPKNNIFRDNWIHHNQDYMIKMKQADNNIFENNRFSNNLRALRIEYSNGNQFIANQMENNSESYYYPRYDSSNTVKDVQEVAVKMGDSPSVMYLVNNQHKVWGNDKEVPTEVGGGEAKLTMQRSITGSLTEFRQLQLVIIPESDSLTVRPTQWGAGAGKSWMASSNTSTTIPTKLLVGDLESGNYYEVWVNGTGWQEFQADTYGEIEFSYPIGSQVEFELKEGTGEMSSSSPDDPSVSPSPMPSTSPEPSLSPSPTPEATLDPSPSPSPSSTPLPTNEPTPTPSPDAIVPTPPAAPNIPTSPPARGVGNRPELPNFPNFLQLDDTRNEDASQEELEQLGG